jgi:hypothetical protein
MLLFGATLTPFGKVIACLAVDMRLVEDACDGLRKGFLLLRRRRGGGAVIVYGRTLLLKVVLRDSSILNDVRCRPERVEQLLKYGDAYA